MQTSSTNLSFSAAAASASGDFRPRGAEHFVLKIAINAKMRALRLFGIEHGDRFDIVDEVASQGCENTPARAMKLSWNRLALIFGAFILALMAIDGLIRMNQSAMADFGVGESTLVAADSAAALFLVGLIVGVVLGIAIFFGYLVWREKKYAEEPDQLDLLLEEIAADEKRNALYVDDKATEERTESLDPWERGADWWKTSDED